MLARILPLLALNRRLVIRPSVWCLESKLTAVRIIELGPNAYSKVCQYFDFGKLMGKSLVALVTCSATSWSQTTSSALLKGRRSRKMTGGLPMSF